MKARDFSFIGRLYRKVKEHTITLALKHPASVIGKASLKFLGVEAATSVALWRDCIDFRIAIVADLSHYNAVSPDFGDRVSESSTGVYQAISAYRLHSAIVNAYSPVYSTPRCLIFPDHLVGEAGRVTTEVTTDAGGLYRNGPSLLRSLCSTRHIKQGIHVGGAGAFNWFHFVLECLPKALLAKEWLPGNLREYPLLAPIECQRIESFRQALDVIAGGKPIQYLNRSELALVDDLIVFDEISTAPFNMAQGRWPVLADYRQHDNIVMQVIAKLRAGLRTRVSSVQGGGKRLFLVRSNGRRSYNQSELVDIAISYGFESVTPELLPLREQAALFKGASLIVGPSGAAWVGMIFAEHHIDGLSWLPAEYKGFCSYSTLATLLGHRLKFIECMPDHQLTSTGDAYTATYMVDPSVFENALQSLIG